MSIEAGGLEPIAFLQLVLNASKLFQHNLNAYTILDRPGFWQRMIWMVAIWPLGKFLQESIIGLFFFGKHESI